MATLRALRPGAQVLTLKNWVFTLSGRGSSTNLKVELLDAAGNLLSRHNFKTHKAELWVTDVPGCVAVSSDYGRNLDRLFTDFNEVETTQLATFSGMRLVMNPPKQYYS